jgi:hypothetical protein
MIISETLKSNLLKFPIHKTLSAITDVIAKRRFFAAAFGAGKTASQ